MSLEKRPVIYQPSLLKINVPVQPVPVNEQGQRARYFLVNPIEGTDEN